MARRKEPVRLVRPAQKQLLLCSSVLSYRSLYSAISLGIALMDIVNGLLNLPDNVIGVRLPKIADDAAVVFPPFDWIDPDDHDFDSTWSGQLWRNLGAAPPHSREETTIAAFKVRLFKFSPILTSVAIRYWLTRWM